MRSPLARWTIGITGTFGSGKSSVARFLKRLGAQAVIDFDRLAHEVFRPRHALRKRIASLVGVPQRRLARKRVADKVFSNPRVRERLELIVHPYVFGRVRRELKRHPKGVVIVEVPLLFETGFDRECDATISVIASERVAVHRLKPKGFSAREVRARLRAQLPAREKKRRADFYIVNNGSKQALREKAVKVWRQMTKQYNLNQ